jgi:hypothetical protein
METLCVIGKIITLLSNLIINNKFDKLKRNIQLKASTNCQAYQ